MTADRHATSQAAAVADPDAREFLRDADPVLVRLMPVQTWAEGMDGRAPTVDAFRTLDFSGRLTDESVATRFADDITAQRARACEESAERVAAAG